MNAPAEDLLSAIESILLVAPEAVTAQDLARATQTGLVQVDEALSALGRSLTGGIRLQEHGGAFRLVTAPENTEVVQRYLGAARPPSLSRGALETLTVVAYRQPVTRAEVEALRGVDSDRSIRTLTARGLIEESGRRPTPGRPAEYRTTAEFLEYFGLRSLGELPPLPEDLEEGSGAPDLGLRRYDPRLPTPVSRATGEGEERDKSPTQPPSHDPDRPLP